MSSSTVLILALGIGIVAGLRSMTAPAVVCWATHLNWIHLQNSSLAFLGSTVALYIFTAGAIVELVVDKLPKAPSRKEPPGLIARFVLGGLSGAALCAAGNHSVVIGAILGGLGGLSGAFAGYEARMRLVKALKVPDFVVAVLEDAVAIGAGFLLASRF